MNLPIKNIALLSAMLTVSVVLAGCGNKAPLVKPSDIPAKTPAEVPVAVQPAEVPAADPAAAPASEPASSTPAIPR